MTNDGRHQQHIRKRPSASDRWKLAHHHTGSFSSRPSSVGSRLFFSSNEKDSKKDWKTLPVRLLRLRDHLLRTVSGVDSVVVAADPLRFESHRVALTAAVFASAPGDFLTSFRDLFSAALTVRQSEWTRTQEEEEDSDGLIQDDPSILDMEDGEVYASLRILGWIPRKLSHPLCEAIHGAILSAVRDRISGEFEEEDLFDKILAWKDAVIIPWVRDVMGENEMLCAGEWDRLLDYATCDVYECFCDVRIGEIFEIVAEYPDSLPAVRELRDALERTRMHESLAEELRASLARRLIHPGANTSQIIEVYINTIKVLRVIDPSDGLLEAVAHPVRSYLRSRSDTVRCIIASLTDEKADLYEELRRQDVRPLEQTQLDSDDEEDTPDSNWLPAPKQRAVVDLASSSGGGGGSRGSWDILSMLVGIYGSNELFVNEYRVMLANKLLSNLDYNTDKEVHNLELLKLRFGETSMRQCEVMIKDMDDSKRINTNIHSTIQNKTQAKKKQELIAHKRRLKWNPHGHSNTPISPSADDSTTPPPPVVDAAIVSHIFWPTLQKEQLKAHPTIQEKLDQFSIEYAKLKNPRRLIWLSQLGTVQVELDVEETNEDGSPYVTTREFTCSPLHATLIMYFQDRNRWTASELSDETGVAEDVIQRKMPYWMNGRVIRIVTGGVYELCGSEHHVTDEDDIGDEEYEEGQAVSVGAQEAEEMQVYESYVTGMLANMGELPLNRIHNMLKMFVTGSDHKYDKTPQQIGMFLQKMCREDKLECSSEGLYKLLKK